MRLLQAKNEPDRFPETLSKPVGGANRSTLVKAGLIAGGLAALTAGSAAISSIRRRMEASGS
jgi:hypothetical protein